MTKEELKFHLKNNPVRWLDFDIHWMKIQGLSRVSSGLKIQGKNPLVLTNGPLLFFFICFFL